MATSSYAKALIGGLEQDLKRMFYRVMEYMFDHNLEFGPITHQGQSANFRGVYLKSTTAAESSQEFNVEHGLERVPNMMFQIGDPLTINSEFGVPLKVTRAADNRRVYLSSPSTSVPIILYVE